MQHICVAGPAGSGKGRLIKELLKLMGQAGHSPVLITAGPILVERSKANNGEGRQIRRALAKRQMVPHNIVMRALTDEYVRKVKSDTTQVVLDGCPRTPKQAQEVRHRFRGNRYIIISVVASLERCKKNALENRRREDDHPELLESAYQRYLDLELPAVRFLVEEGVEIIEVRCPEYDQDSDWDIKDQAALVLKRMRLGRVLRLEQPKRQPEMRAAMG